MMAASFEAISQKSLLVRIALVHNGKAKDSNLELFDNYLKGLSAPNLMFSIIQGQGNIGYGAGQNLAFQTYKSEFHLFMNPDVELNPDALAEGLSYLRSNPDVAIVCPSATEGDGSIQYLCKRFPSVLDLFLRGLIPETASALFSTRLARYELQDLSDSQPTKGVPIVSGCFMLCRSALVERVGGFDPAYFLYFEDFDLSIRVQSEGYLAYLPSMCIKHRGGHAAKKGLKHIMFFCQSGIRFFKNHGVKWF